MASHALQHNVHQVIRTATESRRGFFARLGLRDYALVGLGAILNLFAASELLAWSIGALEFVQLDTSRLAPHYNHAFLFLALSFSLMAAGFRFFTVSRIITVFAGLFGLAILINGLPGCAFGLDQWIWQMKASSASPVGKGQTLDSTLLILSAMLLFLITLQKRSYFLELAVVVLAILIGPALLCVCFVPILGMQTPLDRLPIVNLISVMLVGLAGAINSPPGRMCACSDRKLLPGLICIFGIGLTLILRDGLAHDRRERISRQVELELSQVRQRLKDELSRNQKEVMRLAESWEQWTPEERTEKVGSYIGMDHGCLNVARVHPNLSLTWMDVSRSKFLPENLSALLVGPDFIDAANAGRAKLAKPKMSPWDWVNTGRIHRRVLFIYSPCRENHSEFGGILSILNVSDSFEPILRNSPFGTAVTDDDGYLFGKFESQPGGREEWGQELRIEYPNFEGRIILWPTREALAKENLQFPEIALGIGFLLTVLLVLAAFLAQKARSRAAEVEAALSERERAQFALTQSEVKYRTLIENLGQGVFLQDVDHRYVAANAEFCRIVGWTEEQLRGMTESDLFDPARAGKHALDVQKVLDEGCRVESEQEGDKGDQRVIVRQTLTPVRDASGKTTGVLGICWDVTEQRRLEAHVLQASKMDAIGQLAGGIAHDFNNLLTAILGNLQLISEILPPESDCREFAEEATTATERAAGLTRRLLGFSRKHHQLNWVTVDMPALVDEVMQLLRRSIDPLVRIELNKFGELPNVAGDPGQLHQVLMNLCINARDAIGESGLITIELERKTIRELPVHGSLHARMGDFVRLSVTDSGSGMTDEVKARIYEPFFTTKEVGKGTGLGLAMVFAIVRQHDGWIDCWSEVGKGTRFDLYLPTVEASVKKHDRREVLPEPPTCRETILVVDDEEIVRRLAVAVLRTKGYTVLEAQDGQQAVEIYEREQKKIDLVLLDLTMPILSGHDAFRKMQMMNPRVKVIFMSGYSAAKLTDLEKETMLGFINKPYMPQDLVNLVGRAIKRGESAKAETLSQGPLSSSDEIMIDDTELDFEEVFIGSRNF